MDSLKRHNTYPYLLFEFTENEAPVDCTIYDINLVIKNQTSGVIVNALIGGVDSSAKWDDEPKGIGHYEWDDIATDTLGEFQYEFKFVRKSDGEKFSIPEKGFFDYTVTADIDVPPAVPGG